MTETIAAGRRRIDISHPGKVMFPEAGLTKLDLARHYERVAALMVPLVRDHPVAMHAFPGGVARPGYYMKEVPEHFPDWVRRVTVAKHGGTVTHVLANDAATLVYLANQNCITPHIWTARADRVREPDRVVFDLDPPGTRFADVRAAARTLGDILRDLGLTPFAMTTGSRGLHVTVPLRRGADYEDVRAFSRRVAGVLADHDPKRLTTEVRKAKRDERIFIDTGRNAYAQHAVAPYAVRPRPTAPVATPLRWDELSDRRLRPDRWTITTIAKRLDDDPWSGFR
ncbi:MAG: bifunctional non-ous end joining protein LigD, partial [Thermoleophilaceae bacterium]|nr:bifunctional non-ous end joining protein LigD [Thermoleophilaceae bacterium]